MSRRHTLLVLGLLGLTAACATMVVQRTSPPKPIPPVVVQKAPPPPEPPPLQYAVDSLPAWEIDKPDFPFLPGEASDHSLSVGDVSTGFLVNSVAIPSPHPSLAVLPVQFSRRLLYTSEAMLNIVEQASFHLQESYPKSVVFLGNFGAQGGGDIPYSVSHNSGRDADVAFFMTDAQGTPVEPPDLLPVSDEGTWTDPDTGEVLVFDVPRNWKLVEGLVKAGDSQIQYIFVSNGLKKLLLDYGRAQGSPWVTSAEYLLWQPGGALPHDDHFHVRIFCSAADVAAGCVDRGRRGKGYQPYTRSRVEAVKQAIIALSADEPRVRAAATQRLALLRAKSEAKRISTLLGDPEPSVRVQAARSLVQLKTGGAALQKRLTLEEHPHVRLELIVGLGNLKSKAAAPTLTALLKDGRQLLVDVVGEMDERTVVADALIQLERPEAVGPLVAELPQAPSHLFARFIQALQILTNQGFETSEEWTAWFESEKNKGRNTWLVEGFQRAGFQVMKLNIKYVWELCQAILGPDYVSHNAQRELMRLARREVPSLDWSKEDASFYWRRWFERRISRYRAPPIPLEMSTLTNEP